MREPWGPSTPAPAPRADRGQAVLVQGPRGGGRLKRGRPRPPLSSFLVRYPVVQVRPGVRPSPGHLWPGRRDQDDIARLEDRDVLGGQPPKAARPTAEDPVR